MADFKIELEYDGIVCGIDEVGRGPLAGPVVAASVYVPPTLYNQAIDLGITDSKKLSEKKRDVFFDWVCSHCVWGLGQCSPEEIDDLNILWASMKAMNRAFEDMRRKISGDVVMALIDGNRIPPDFSCDAKAVVKGDQKSISIAAASIFAKVTRDKIMTELAREYPMYGWEKNSAYPSPAHKLALQEHGVTPHHRKSFAPVKALLSH